MLPLQPRSALALWLLAACNPSGPSPTARVDAHSAQRSSQVSVSPDGSRPELAPERTNDAQRRATAEHRARPRGAEQLLLLHGLGDSGANFARALGASELATRFDLRLHAPDGARDSAGRRHWNAGRACCDFDGLGTDHVGELRRAAQGRPTIVAGFSNGSFMAHRLACENDEVVGVVSIAGGDPLAEGRPCEPARPIAFIHVHGTADQVVPPYGGHVLGDTSRAKILPAEATVLAWGKRNGCDLAAGLRERTRLDLLPSSPGAETRVLSMRGCRAPVELWLSEGASHLSVLSPSVLEAALAALGSPGEPSTPH